MVPRWPQDRLKRALGGVLGRLGEVLGCSWGLLGPLWEAFGSSCGGLGLLLGALRPSWSDLGDPLICMFYVFVFCIEFSCGCLALIPVVDVHC